MTASPMLSTRKKSEPILFACKNENEEIEISMQYEGFPIEPIKIFMKVIEKKWSNYSGSLTSISCKLI